MNSFVYKWTNQTLDKIYIGYHKGTEDDGYVCSSSSTTFWEDFKNPNHVWKRDILFCGGMKECQLMESKLLDEIDITSDSVYNNKNNLMFNITDEVRGRLKAAASKRGQDPEYKRLQSERTKQQWENNPERRAKQSAFAKTQIMADSTKQKIKEARARQIITPESRKKAAEKIKGTKYPREHGEKISIARRNAPPVTCPHCGKAGKLGGGMSRFHLSNCKQR